MDRRFYVKHPDQWPFIEDFSEMMLKMADITFFQPSPVAAPWHWQASVGGVTFNFWPHKNKWNVETEPVRYNIREAEKEMRRAEEDGGPLIEED